MDKQKVYKIMVVDLVGRLRTYQIPASNDTFARFKAQFITWGTFINQKKQVAESNRAIKFFSKHLSENGTHYFDLIQELQDDALIFIVEFEFSHLDCPISDMVIGHFFRKYSTIDIFPNTNKSWLK